MNTRAFYKINKLNIYKKFCLENLFIQIIINVNFYTRLILKSKLRLKIFLFKTKILKIYKTMKVLNSSQ